MSSLMKHIKRCAVVVLLAGLAVADETTSKVDWDDLPRGLRRAKRRYDKSVEDAGEAHEEELARAERQRQDGLGKARKELIAAIETEMKTAMRQEDLDAALALRNAKELVESLAKPEEQDPKEVLVGTWVFGKCAWTFGRRGRVVSAEHGRNVDTGSWTITDTHVHIVWGNRMGNNRPFWSAIRLPLDESGTIVDNWSGIAKFTVTKKADD